MSQFNSTPSLTFQEAVKTAFDKITQFQGRSRRSEYWWTVLAVYGASILLQFVITPLGSLILSLSLMPLTFRRLHDTGRSGWCWIIAIFMNIVTLIVMCYDIFVNAGSEDTIYIKYGLIFLILLLYRILLIVYLCQDSDPNTNKYGESPKYREIDKNIINN